MKILPRHVARLGGTGPPVRGEGSIYRTHLELPNGVRLLRRQSD